MTIDPVLAYDVTADDLMAQAVAATGLDDWGSDLRFRTGLHVALDAVAKVGHAPPVLQQFYGQMGGLLATRLHLVEDETSHPEVLLGEIERPLILIGLARTGTTILHDLLALDPAIRAPREWETAAPWPAPEIATFDTDPRIAAVDGHLEQLLTAAPQLRSMHPWGATLPSDCLNLMALHFASAAFWAAYAVDDFARWLSVGGADGVYATHRRVLQQLQWKGPKGRWTLKEPTHQLNLQALVAEYPDACLVQTHRDPGRTIPSAADLVYTIQAISKPDVDRHATGAMARELFGACIERSTAARDAEPSLDERVLDVAYADTVTDPIGQVRRIYNHVDLPFSDEHAARITAHLAENTQDKHGAHTYTAEQYGLSADELAGSFARYRERFGALLHEPERI
jgi:Sulfotransferase family